MAMFEVDRHYAHDKPHPECSLCAKDYKIATQAAEIESQRVETEQYRKALVEAEARILNLTEGMLRLVEESNQPELTKDTKDNKPCDCIERLEGLHWVHDCYCQNSGDMSAAQAWCTEKNLSEQD